MSVPSFKDSFEGGEIIREVGSDSGGDDLYKWLEDEITRMSVQKDYKGSGHKTDTPLDWFDEDCHTVEGGIGTKENKELIDEEDELMFLINLSEHVKRPKDSLMFIGEYFKQAIRVNNIVYENIKSEGGGNRIKHQDKFYITADIMNSLATAAKMYIENMR